MTSEYWLEKIATILHHQPRTFMWDLSVSNIFKIKIRVLMSIQPHVKLHRLPV